MNRRVVIGIIVALVVTGSAAGVVLARPDAAPAGPPAQAGTGGPLKLSGFIEAEQIELAPEIGGRVVELPFEQGDTVEAGDVVLRLDTTLLDAQREIAAAQLAIVQAQRDLLKRGVREEVVAVAEAQVAVAEAAVSAAQETLNAVWMVRSNPQDVLVQIAEVEAQIAAAQHQINAANVGLRAAQKKQEVYEATANEIERIEKQFGEHPGLYIPFELVTAPQEIDTAVERLNGAQEVFNRANELLAALHDLADNPQQLQAQVVAAQNALDAAQAELKRAQAELDQVRAGPRAEQLQAAEGQVGEAEAALAAIDARIERMTLTAPVSGLVLEQTIHVGELAAPGLPVITLANLDVVELTVFVPAADLGRVELGQEVAVTVDSFPGRRFEGTISAIADEAEFTPTGVRTPEERVNLVYRVSIRLENPDHALKPGMPADATIR